MPEDELDIRNTAYFMFGGVYYGYLLNFSVNREYMNVRYVRLLFEAFLDQIEAYAKDGIFFKKWCVNVFLPEHEKMYESLGFEYLCPNKLTGKMYGLSLDPYPEQQLFTQRETLQQLYEDRFRVKCYQMDSDTKLTADEEREVSQLIYETDAFIYPAMFGSRQQAMRMLPRLIREQDEMFRTENFFVARQGGHVVGLILWYKGALHWDAEKFVDISDAMGLELSPDFDLVVEEYVESYAEQTDEETISIINCCVAREVRGRGIGKKLMSSFLRKHMKQRVELCVLKDNTSAVRLYEENRFQTVKERNGFSVDGRDLPCLEMVREKR